MSTEQDKAATKPAEATPPSRLSPYDAVAEAMRLASLMGGSIGMGNVEKAMAYETRLRSHLIEYIYPPESPLASLQQAVPSTVKESLTDGEHAEPAQAAVPAEPDTPNPDDFLSQAPASWSEDQRKDWATAQAAMAGKSMWRAYARKLQALLAAQPKAEPVREVEAVQFATYDVDNGIELHNTETDAMEYAEETLKYYREAAKFDGEWPGDTDSMWVGTIHITHKPVATEPDEEGGVDYELRATHPAPATAQAQLSDEQCDALMDAVVRTYPLHKTTVYPRDRQPTREAMLAALGVKLDKEQAR